MMRIPFDELQLGSRLKDVQIALLSPRGKRRQILSPGEQAVQAFGTALFTALLVGEVAHVGLAVHQPDLVVYQPFVQADVDRPNDPGKDPPFERSFLPLHTDQT